MHVRYLRYYHCPYWCGQDTGSKWGQPRRVLSFARISGRIWLWLRHVEKNTSMHGSTPCIGQDRNISLSPFRITTPFSGRQRGNRSFCLPVCAYCRMPNLYHLLLQKPNVSLTRCMARQTGFIPSISTGGIVWPALFSEALNREVWRMRSK
jgi:hypothetical protein